MNTANSPSAALAEDDVNTCVRVLRAIEADRSLLTALTQDRRRELLTLDGWPRGLSGTMSPEWPRHSGAQT
jgi:hypothetical protein